MATIGIDLGTSNSAAAVMRGGRPVIIPSAEGIEAALKKMEEHGVRRLPIVDVDGALVGILMLDDILQFYTAQQSELVALVAREQRHERQYRL